MNIELNNCSFKLSWFWKRSLHAFIICSQLDACKGVSRTIWVNFTYIFYLNDIQKAFVFMLFFLIPWSHPSTKHICNTKVSLKDEIPPRLGLTPHLFTSLCDLNKCWVKHWETNWKTSVRKFDGGFLKIAIMYFASRLFFDYFTSFTSSVYHFL